MAGFTGITHDTVLVCGPAAHVTVLADGLGGGTVYNLRTKELGWVHLCVTRYVCMLSLSWMESSTPLVP